MDTATIIKMCEKYINSIILRKFPEITHYEILDAEKMTMNLSEDMKYKRLIFVFWMTNKDEDRISDLRDYVENMLSSLGADKVIPYFEFLNDRK